MSPTTTSVASLIAMTVSSVSDVAMMQEHERLTDVRQFGRYGSSLRVWRRQSGANDLLQPVMTMAGRANAVEMIADIGDGFQVMRLGGLIGPVGRVGEFLHVRVPLRVERAPRDHHGVGGFRERRGAAGDVFPVIVGLG